MHFGRFTARDFRIFNLSCFLTPPKSAQTQKKVSFPGTHGSTLGSQTFPAPIGDRQFWPKRGPFRVLEVTQSASANRKPCIVLRGTTETVNWMPFNEIGLWRHCVQVRKIACRFCLEHHEWSWTDSGADSGGRYTRAFCATVVVWHSEMFDDKHDSEASVSSKQVFWCAKLACELRFFHNRCSFCLAPVLIRGTFLLLAGIRAASARSETRLHSVLCLQLQAAPQNWELWFHCGFCHGFACWAHSHVDLPVLVWSRAITSANPTCAIEPPRSVPQ